MKQNIKSIETEVEVIKKDIEVIKTNHLAHIEKDVNNINKKVDKLDARMWWVLGLLVAGTVGPMLANLFT